MHFLIVLFALILFGYVLYPERLEAARIDSFEAVPDCIFPNPRSRILSYRASGGVFRARIIALHRGGRMRTFYSQSSGRTPFPAMGATGVQDPGAAADVEAYPLIVNGEYGSEVTRRLDFRYRRAVFDLLSSAFHARVTSGTGRLALYQSFARVANIDSLSCSARVGLRPRRVGSADISESRSGTPIVRCEVMWDSVRDARAGALVRWTAFVTDPCIPGRITRTAGSRPVP